MLNRLCHGTQQLLVLFSAIFCHIMQPMLQGFGIAAPLAALLQCYDIRATSLHGHQPPDSQTSGSFVHTYVSAMFEVCIRHLLTSSPSLLQGRTDSPAYVQSVLIHTKSFH